MSTARPPPTSTRGGVGTSSSTTRSTSTSSPPRMEDVPGGLPGKRTATEPATTCGGATSTATSTDALASLPAKSVTPMTTSSPRATSPGTIVVVHWYWSAGSASQKKRALPIDTTGAATGS